MRPKILTFDIFFLNFMNHRQSLFTNLMSKIYFLNYPIQSSPILPRGADSSSLIKKHEMELYIASSKGLGMIRLVAT